MNKANKRQYSTDDHDVHTITKEEYDKRKKKKINWRRLDDKEKVYLHKSTYADKGEKVW